MRRRRTSSVVLLGGLAAAVALAGLWGLAAARRGGDEPPAPPAPAVIAAPATSGAPPAPAVRTPDAAGAEAAALDYARAAEALLGVDDAAAAAAQREMAAEASADALVAGTLERLRAFRAGFPGPVSYRVAPVASRVAVTGPATAEAAVWYVSVLASPRRPAVEDWRTVRFRLVWERDDWRVASEEDRPGPRPAPLPRLAPTPPDEFAAALAGFGPVGGGGGGRP